MERFLCGIIQGWCLRKSFRVPGDVWRSAGLLSVSETLECQPWTFQTTKSSELDDVCRDSDFKPTMTSKLCDACRDSDVWVSLRGDNLGRMVLPLTFYPWSCWELNHSLGGAA